MRRTLMINSALVAIRVAFFSARLTENSSQAQAAKPQTTGPDFSGIWLGKGSPSLSRSDPRGNKAGMEGDISYTPWGLQKLKSVKPGIGGGEAFLDTNDLALKFADPDGYPRASIHPMRFKVVQSADF